MAGNESRKKAEVRRKAEADRATYDALDDRDDEFDLPDTLVASAISMLAVTSPTQKRWLFAAALVVTAGGVLMGLSGPLGWHLHPDTVTRCPP